MEAAVKARPDFNINDFTVMEIKRERRRESEDFWTGAVFGFVAACLLWTALASAMSAFGQDPQGLEAKPASAVTAEGGQAPKGQSNVR